MKEYSIRKQGAVLANAAELAAFSVATRWGGRIEMQSGLWLGG